MTAAPSSLESMIFAPNAATIMPSQWRNTGRTILGPLPEVSPDESSPPPLRPLTVWPVYEATLRAAGEPMLTFVLTDEELHHFRMAYLDLKVAAHALAALYPAAPEALAVAQALFKLTSPRPPKATNHR